MTDVEQEIRELKTRLDNAARARSRAEFEKDAAKASAEKAKQTLREEFGVSSVDEAKEMLESLRGELSDLVREIKSTLDGLA